MITPENMKMHDEFGEKLASKMNLFQLTSQLKHSAKAIPKLKVKKYNWWNESLHGVARAGVATVFPQAIAMASTFSDEMMFQVAQIIATEARAKYNENQKKRDFGIYKGLTMWSPNINIYRDPRWGRGHETYGEDPYLTGKLGVAFIKGLQGDDEKYLKASACAKHFAVHSGPEAKRHSFNAVVSKKDMFETYLPAFEEAVRDGKATPLKSLIKFQRIHLKQGEQTTVSLNFNESDFYSIDEDGNKVFTKGIYNLIIQDGQNINDSSLTFTNENDDLIVEKCPI